MNELVYIGTYDGAPIYLCDTCGWYVNGFDCSSHRCNMMIKPPSYHYESNSQGELERVYFDFDY